MMTPKISQRALIVMNVHRDVVMKQLCIPRSSSCWVLETSDIAGNVGPTNFEDVSQICKLLSALVREPTASGSTYNRLIHWRRQ